MKRRNFLKKLPLIAAPFALNGVPLKLLSQTTPLSRMAALSDNDRVLVILQLHGGNDGINTIIPVGDYDQYYARRANIAIPLRNSQRKLIELDTTMPAADQVGLHPDMRGLKHLYDIGRMNVIQGVSYENNNGSHFRGRDIQFMGGGSDDYLSSGWVGRYLQTMISPSVYPDDFPNDNYPDPLAIELGSEVSLIFHQDGNIPASISLGGSPERLANLVDTLDGFQDEGIDPRGLPPEGMRQTPYGKELEWILGLETKTVDYAERLREVYQRSPRTSVVYPEIYPLNAPRGSKRNPLTPQLQLVARLLDGGGPGRGVGTKVFLVRIGGFDTHANQTENYDPTMGGHAALLYHISEAMRAFQDDLKSRGIEDRVLTVTTSEFGRRVHSNGSYGTDHGTGAPILVMGKGAQGGVIGKNPDLSRNNVDMQFDFRQIYANILKDWMLVDEAKINTDIFFENFIDGPNPRGGMFEPLPIAQQIITGTAAFVDQRYALGDCYPNPASGSTRVAFRVPNTERVSITLLDTQGRQVRSYFDQQTQSGEHTLDLSLQGLPSGSYILMMQTGGVRRTKKIVVLP